MKNIIISVVLSFFIFCSNYDNPFTDPSNAQVVVLKQGTSFNADTISTLQIFSSETLTVTTTVPELISWLWIEATNNRLSPFDTIFEPKAQDYKFIFSCFDTGYQEIQIYTKRKNGDLITQKITVNLESPLKQIDLINHEFTDSITLSTPAVKDQVVYTWDFGTGGTIITTPFSSQKALINTVNSFKNKGILYVSDNRFRSPADSFSFLFYDSIPLY